MLDAGWPDEAKRLLALPRPLSKEAGQALGYKDLFAHLAGNATWADTVATIQTRTRQFAKRQLTWFRPLPAATWVPPGAGLAARVREAWAKDSAGADTVARGGATGNRGG